MGIDERFITVLVRADELWHGSLGEYLRRVVPAEMPALWPEDALRAQAVACRSYAVWRMAHRRSEQIDIYGDESDQVFAEARIHPRTDAAILATAGVVLTLGGDVFPTRYVSRCGRADCSTCRGKGGHLGKRWEGRLCQYGARYLAEEGLSWHEILQAYYPGVSIVETGGPTPGGPSVGDGPPATEAERGNRRSVASDPRSDPGEAGTQRQSDSEGDGQGCQK